MDWWGIVLLGATRSAVRPARTDPAATVARLRAYRRELRELRKNKQTGRDDAQDATIAELRTELDQVQVALGVLAQLLVERGCCRRTS